MRNLLTGSIASLGLAILLAGSASAADMSSSSNIQQAGGNLALQNQLERDATSHSRLHQAPAGVIIALGDTMPQLSRVEQSASGEGSSAWLERSPTGQVVGQ